MLQRYFFFKKKGFIRVNHLSPYLALESQLIIMYFVVVHVEYYFYMFFQWEMALQPTETAEVCFIFFHLLFAFPFCYL